MLTLAHAHELRPFAGGLLKSSSTIQSQPKNLENTMPSTGVPGLEFPISRATAGDSSIAIITRYRERFQYANDTSNMH